MRSGEHQLTAAVIDAANGFAYFGTQTFGTNVFPGIVVKINLNNFTRVGNLTLNARENSVAIDVCH